MPFYEDMQKIAGDVLKEFKQGDVFYVDLVNGAGPADDPGEPTLQRYAIDAVVNGVKFKYIQSAQALGSDLQVTASVDARFTPRPEGFIDVDNVRYKIHKLIPRPAAGITVAHVFIIRR